LKRAVTEEDIVRLTEIKIKRISKFDLDKAKQHIESLEEKIADFYQTEDTILYAAAFDANGGVFEPLFTKEDAIISDELNHLVMKMIERDPSDRYQSTSEVLEDINSLNKGKKVDHMKGCYEDETEEHSMKKQIILLTSVISTILLILIAVILYFVFFH